MSIHFRVGLFRLRHGFPSLRSPLPTPRANHKKHKRHRNLSRPWWAPCAPRCASCDFCAFCGHPPRTARPWRSTCLTGGSGVARKIVAVLCSILSVRDYSLLPKPAQPEPKRRVGVAWVPRGFRPGLGGGRPFTRPGGRPRLLGGVSHLPWPSKGRQPRETPITGSRRSAMRIHPDTSKLDAPPTAFKRTADTGFRASSKRLLSVCVQSCP